MNLKPLEGCIRKNIYLDEVGRRHRRCNNCHTIKLEIDNFEYNKRHNYFHGICRECRREKNREFAVIKNRAKLESLSLDGYQAYDLQKTVSYIGNDGRIYRKCSRCKIIKLEEESYHIHYVKGKKKNKYLRYSNYCKNCYNGARQEYTKNNIDKIRERRKTDEFKTKRREAKKKRLQNDPQLTSLES